MLPLGGFSELRFERSLLRGSPVGPALAEHRDHAWQVSGARYARLDCEGPLTLQFEHADGTRGEVHGPFQRLSSIDGVMYADRQLFATFQDGTGVWTQEPTGVGYAIIVARSEQP